MSRASNAIVEPKMPKAKRPRFAITAPPNMGRDKDANPVATSFAPSICPLLSGRVKSLMIALVATLVALQPRPSRMTPKVMIA